MRSRCGLLALVLVASALASPTIWSGPSSLFLDAAQNKPSETTQGRTGRTDSSADSPAKQKGILHLRGILVEGGAECQRFRATNNRFYTLTGNLRGFHTGDIVEITGKIPQASHCMQDTTIQILTIRKAKPSTPQTNDKTKPNGAPKHGD